MDHVQPRIITTARPSFQWLTFGICSGSIRYQQRLPRPRKGKSRSMRRLEMTSKRWFCGLRTEDESHRTRRWEDEPYRVNKIHKKWPRKTSCPYYLSEEPVRSVHEIAQTRSGHTFSSPAATSESMDIIDPRVCRIYHYEIRMVCSRWELQAIAWILKDKKHGKKKNASLRKLSIPFNVKHTFSANRLGQIWWQTLVYRDSKLVETYFQLSAWSQCSNSIRFALVVADSIFQTKIGRRNAYVFSNIHIGHSRELGREICSHLVIEVHGYLPWLARYSLWKFPSSVIEFNELVHLYHDTVSFTRQHFFLTKEKTGRQVRIMTHSPVFQTFNSKFEQCTTTITPIFFLYKQPNQISLNDRCFIILPSRIRPWLLQNPFHVVALRSDTVHERYIDVIPATYVKIAFL